MYNKDFHFLTGLLLTYTHSLQTEIGQKIMVLGVLKGIKAAKKGLRGNEAATKYYFCNFKGCKTEVRGVGLDGAS